jgi:hypothetical protein
MTAYLLITGTSHSLFSTEQSMEYDTTIAGKLVGKSELAVNQYELVFHKVCNSMGNRMTHARYGV